MRKTIAVLFIAALAAGCKPSPVELKEKDLLRAYKDFKGAAAERDLKQDALKYLQSRASDLSAGRRTAQAQRELDRAALSGRAGTTEQLIAAKKVLAGTPPPSGPLTSEVQEAWDRANALEREYDDEARKVHETLLPALLRARAEYEGEVKAATAAGPRSKPSADVQKVLVQIDKEVEQDKFWVWSVQMRQEARKGSASGGQSTLRSAAGSQPVRGENVGR